MALLVEHGLNALAPLCHPVKRGRADLLLVSRSWEPRDLRADLRRLTA